MIDSLVLLGISGVLLITIGIGLAVRAQRSLLTASRKITEGDRQISRLHTAAADMERYAEAQRMWEEAAKTPPLDLMAAYRNACPGQIPDDVRESYTDLGGGWRVRQKAFSVADVSVGSLMAFIRVAESSRPPWRLADYEIHAGGKPGVADVKLAFETLVPMARP